MGRLVEGEWTTEWYEPDEAGRFKRPETVFRDSVRKDGSTPFEPAAGRYHLYVAYACPWAHRTLLTRNFKGLEHAIDVSIVHPFMGDDGWHFDADEPGCTPDKLFGYDYLREVYVRGDSNYTGRVTVPVLWDTETDSLVNNESKEVIEMLDQEFDEIAQRDVELFPDDLYEEVHETIDRNYGPINDGVYRCGFATTQEAYEEAANALFAELDHCEEILSQQRYLCGSRFTAADICLFTTLVRFDIVYYTHFKTNRRHIFQYDNLWNFTKEIYQMPGVAATINVEQTKRHYFQSHETVNPKRFVPIGPDLAFDSPHDRDRFG